MINENDEDEPKSVSQGITLELGDLIEIISPTNEDYHQQTFFILYIDLTKKIRIFNVSTNQIQQLNLDEDGTLTDESITQIQLLSRSNEKGFARQNKLLPKTWVDIHFGGEIPITITGEITNLEEDMIEITTFPDSDVLMIDFAYKGIPEDIPIEKIVMREIPQAAYLSSKEPEQPGMVSEKPSAASITYTDNGESIITIPEGSLPDDNIEEVLQSIYLNANDLFGEQIEDIFQVVEIPEHERRFGLDTQLNDFTDELLSTIPNTQRTKKVMNNIHMIVSRFRELRSMFSNFDANGNVVGKKIYGEQYKPLVDRILNLDTKLQWIMPVVQQYKKLYDVAEDMIVENADVFVAKCLDDFNTQYDHHSDYYKNVNCGDELKYEMMIKNDDSLMRPFKEPRTKEGFITFNNTIKTDLEAIVNNIDDFKSTVVLTESSLSPTTLKKYLIQRYNMGDSRIASTEMKHGNKVYIRKQVTAPDKMSIKSLLFFPESFVTYSRIDLPGTNILTRSQLSQTQLQLSSVFRKKKMVINQQFIDSFDKEYNYDEKNMFLSGITEFELDESLINDDERFEKLLKVLIPNTRTLVKLYQKHIQNKYSFVDVTKTLEPFMVYVDNISSYGQYNEIRYFIKNQIAELKKRHAKKSEEFRTLQSGPTNARTYKPLPAKMSTMLSDKLSFETFFKSTYWGEPDSPAIKVMSGMSSSEVLHNMITTDNNQLFSKLLTLMLLSLMTPDKLLGTIENPAIEDMSNEKKIGSKDCTRKFLTKKYTSIADLQKDNNVATIYYDKDMDDTPYDILKKYEIDKKKMLAEKFPDFLAENLVQKHDCPRESSKEMAATLIEGKKRVRNGEYAVLVLTPSLPKDTVLTDNEKEEVSIEENARTKYIYYQRLKNTWVKDDSMGEESFVDTNALFCNIDMSCYKNTKTQTCDPMERTEMLLKRKSAMKAMEEFDKRFSMTMDELSKELDDSINLHHKPFIAKNNQLKEIALTRASFIAYEIGKYAINDDLLGSPYANLRELILAQDDFSKKQTDICRFVNTYCREPLIDEEEDANWLFCKETNVKLFPRSLYILAQTFTLGNVADYQHKLDEVCAFYGLLSDDGDSIVDKHSGYVLRKIDFVSEEGYDESGFKITTNSIIENDLGVVASEALTQKSKKIANKIYEDETTQMVYNIIKTISAAIDIKVEALEEFVIRFSMEMINNQDVVLSEKAYNKRAEKLEKTKGKVQIPFPIYRNQTILTIVGGVLLVAIQTTTPSFKAKKTFPGCIRSFSGFPLDGGVEDMTGLTYIACVMDKSKSSIAPWDSIQKLSASLLTKRMREVLEHYVIKKNEIVELYMKKREYEILNPENQVVAEHSVAKWKHFLPPLVDYEIVKSLRKTTGEFDNEMLSLIRKGHSNQRAHLGVYKSKIFQNTYGIVESINAIVKNKTALLKTAAGIPFLENACCNEKQTNPIAYFKEEDPNIDAMIKATQKETLIVRDVSKLAEAYMMYNDEFTGLKSITIPNGLYDENIYAAFIYYCNFDNDIPIPHDLRLLCHEKPDGYNRSWAIEEKIEYLKKHGKQYNADDYHNLMKVVNARNMVAQIDDTQVKPVEMLKDILENLEMKQSKVVEEPLRKLMLSVIENYNPKTMIYENDTAATPFNKALNRLRNYLTKTNERMYTKIMDFFDRHGNLGRTDYANLQDHLNNLTNWELDRSIVQSGHTYDEGLYTITQFIRNSIYYMIKQAPSIILNNTYPIDKVPSHWGLSLEHTADVTKFVKQYSRLVTPYQKNNVGSAYLQNINTWNDDLWKFVSHLPVHTPIAKNGDIFFSLFDKRTLYMLYTYCWQSAIYEYIESADDVDLLRLEIRERNQYRRNKSSEEEDIWDTVHDTGDNEDMQEYEDDIQAIEIFSGEQSAMKKMVCSLLSVFMKKERDERKMIDRPYKEIVKRMRRTKEQEKKSITDFLQNMEKDERRIEGMLKQYKMGRWNVGMQKGLFQYDKNTYDNNRDANLARMYDDLEQNNLEQVEGVSYDVDELDVFDEADNMAEYDNEGNDITGLDEDYNDGNYYGEDVDHDFGYD